MHAEHDSETDSITANRAPKVTPSPDRLLIIEDNAADSRRLERLLDQVMPDYPREIVQTLRGASESLHQGEPLMIITDLNLPDSDGMDTVDHLLTQSPTVPLVVMTSQGFDAVGLAAVEAGAEDFLTKGTFDALDLARVLLMAVERHRTHLETIRQAHRDGLTGLANRSYFERTLNAALARAVRLGEECAVGFIDVDDFKKINDHYGHLVGDEILCQMADRIRSSIRPYDSAARFGGDELAILITAVSNSRSLAAVVSRIRNALDQPYQLSGGSLTVNLKASIGIALSGTGSASLTADECLHNADRAMYVAKARKAGFIFYDSHFHRHTGERLDVEHELAAALSSPELLVFYQPIVSTQTGELVALEALARWAHPSRGMLDARDFIDIAKSGRFLGRIDRRVLGRSCRQLREWHEAFPGTGSLRMDINTSLDNWRDERWVAFVQQTCTENQVTPSQLCFSVAEEELKRFDQDMLDRLGAMREAGALIAIDHFGVGDMSLRFLTTVPFDVIKVDQTLVHDPSPGLLLTLDMLADHYGARIVGVGVETQEQHDALVAHKVKFAEGFHYAKPEAPDTVADMIRTWRNGFGSLAI